MSSNSTVERRPCLRVSGDYSSIMGSPDHKGRDPLPVRCNSVRTWCSQHQGGHPDGPRTRRARVWGREALSLCLSALLTPSEDCVAPAPLGRAFFTRSATLRSNSVLGTPYPVQSTHNIKHHGKVAPGHTRVCLLTPSLAFVTYLFLPSKIRALWRRTVTHAAMASPLVWWKHL